MTTKSAYMRFRVTDDEKKRFEMLCKSRNLSPSDALRQYVKTELSASQKGEHQDETQIEHAEPRWKVVNTRLTQSEYQSLIVQVKTEKTTISKWLLQIVRERIISGPQLRAEEIQAISQALFRLQSVGRNLNQLVKFLNTASSTKGSAPLIDVIELQDSIRATTGSITHLIKTASVRDFEHV